MPSQNPTQHAGSCATASGAAMPQRRPMIDQITNPQFTPELISKIMVRLNRHIGALEQTLAEARS